MFKYNRSEAAVLVKRWSLSGSIFKAAEVFSLNNGKTDTVCGKDAVFGETNSIWI